MRRSQFEMTLDTLTTISTRTRRTWIMRNANISYLKCEEILKRLLEKGLIIQQDKRHYALTYKGKITLLLYKEASATTGIQPLTKTLVDENGNNKQQQNGENAILEQSPQET